jgi:hypothetical protein
LFSDSLPFNGWAIQLFSDVCLKGIAVLGALHLFQVKLLLEIVTKACYINLGIQPISISIRFSSRLT